MTYGSSRELNRFTPSSQPSLIALSWIGGLAFGALSRCKGVFVLRAVHHERTPITGCAEDLQVVFPIQIIGKGRLS